MVEKVSQHEYPVLLLGESGTGKELVAKCIHYSGPRKDRPFAPADCSSLVPTLLAEIRRKKDEKVPGGGEQRLEIIATLAVRLRETVRRLSEEWEARRNPVP